MQLRPWRRRGVLLRLLLVITTVGGGCRANRPASPRETPAGITALADSLRARERMRLRALVAGDTAVGSALHAEDFELVPPGGGAIGKREYLQAIASGTLDYVHWEPVGEIRVRTFGMGAVLRYQADIEAVYQGTVLARRRFWHLDVYERRGARWQVVWSQATEARP